MVRDLVWEWDPIGVAEIAPRDEYDCLIQPLVSLLSRGAGLAEISEYLRQELKDHFGLDAGRLDVESVADRLVFWRAGVDPRA